MKSRLLLAALALAVATGARETPGLRDAVLQARTAPIAPRPEPPAWMDDARVRRGYAFLEAHQAAVNDAFVTSSLVSTFAAKDIAPVLMQTGKLPKSFTPRMMATGLYMGSILKTPADRDDFLKRNYARSVDLGELHAAVAEAVAGPLAWDPKVRVPMNGQAFAFVLYSFAWWPVEAMVARGEVDPKRDAAALDDWFHLWSVMGYGMGAPEALLPRDYARAKEIVGLLREAQYAGPREPRPEGLPALLGGNVRLLANFARTGTADEKTDAAAKRLAASIALSPGLGEALGLGPDPVAQLKGYAALPPPK